MRRSDLAAGFCRGGGCWRRIFCCCPGWMWNTNIFINGELSGQDLFKNQKKAAARPEIEWLRFLLHGRNMDQQEKAGITVFSSGRKTPVYALAARRGGKLRVLLEPNKNDKGSLSENAGKSIFRLTFFSFLLHSSTKYDKRRKRNGHNYW